MSDSRLTSFVKRFPQDEWLHSGSTSAPHMEENQASSTLAGAVRAMKKGAISSGFAIDVRPSSFRLAGGTDRISTG
jgi:hypothetical protein